MSSADEEAFQARRRGEAPNGSVFIRDFDRGVVETMGAVVKTAQDSSTSQYFLEVKGVEPAPGLPGVPVVFSFPEDVFDKNRMPIILVRRDDISPALTRWHPGNQQYMSGAPGALPVSLEGRTWWDATEHVDQAQPFDLTYTIQIVSRTRGGPAVLNPVNAILKRVLKVYQPYCAVHLLDSLGDVRSYEAFMEGVSNIDQLKGVQERDLGFSVTLRVEGELDLSDPVISRTVSRRLTSRMVSR